jgi:hypothetical protein
MFLLPLNQRQRKLQRGDTPLGQCPLRLRQFFAFKDFLTSVYPSACPANRQVQAHLKLRQRGIKFAFIIAPESAESLYFV